MLSKLASFLLLSQPVLSHSAQEWKQRSIYQIITDRFWRSDNSTENCSDLRKYCGGTWKGIEHNLDYIKNMGFNAIWISPIPENLGDDYHGYAALNWFNVNPHFGSEQDLKDLVKACHEKDIWVMLDVVANHVAPIDEDYSRIIPFNDPSYYHAKC
jgi:alpha-amylase